MKPIACLSIDCEGCGPNHITHGLKSLGWCLGTFEGGVIEKDRLNFQPLPGQVPDPSTLNDFYMTQNPGLWEKLSENALPAKNAIAFFNSILTNYEKRYTLYVLTDCPSYDATLVNYYLMTFGFLPLHFTREGVFRAVHDADSYARGLLYYCPNQPWVSNAELVKRFNIQLPQVTAHFPEDDAEIIFLIHAQLVAIINTQPPE